MAGIFSSFLRMQMLDPLKLRGLVLYLPQFARLFYRLINDSRVPLTTKFVPFLGVLMLLSPPALELDMIPIIGELDWLLVGYITLRLFVWLCPADVVREHVSRIARGS
jgi:hypothetical protein